MKTAYSELMKVLWGKKLMYSDSLFILMWRLKTTASQMLTKQLLCRWARPSVMDIGFLFNNFMKILISKYINALSEVISLQVVFK